MLKVEILIIIDEYKKESLNAPFNLNNKRKFDL